MQVGRAGNTQRPKSVAQWSVVDVQVIQDGKTDHSKSWILLNVQQKWLRRHCGDFYHLYCEAFLEQVVCNKIELGLGSPGMYSPNKAYMCRR